MMNAGDAKVSAGLGRAGTNHSHTLDWLRGIAALAVVGFHISSRLDLPYLARHGYLAVDFFFVLSGFVIAKAYEQRLQSGALSGRNFFVLRTIRLLPMVVAGTILAAAIEVGRPGVEDQALHMREGLTAMVLGSVLVPVMWTTTLETAVFPLNGPMWTLFLEALSNIAFVPWAKARLGDAWLYVLLAVSFLCLAYNTWVHGDIGFGAVPAEFAMGFARIGWSFTAGVLLFRLRDKAPRGNAITVTAGLVALLMVPDLGWFNRVFDLAAVTIAMPLIVWVASASTFNARWADWSGNLSYPVYALHYPLVRVLCVVGLKLDLPVLGRVGFALLGILAIAAASIAIFRFYDQPLRLWLTSLHRKPGRSFSARSPIRSPVDRP
jgi:peptidoglycan/LPS O-acetylase OafA/YrhL